MTVPSAAEAWVSSSLDRLGAVGFFSDSSSECILGVIRILEALCDIGGMSYPKPTGPELRRRSKVDWRGGLGAYSSKEKSPHNAADNGEVNNVAAGRTNLILTYQVGVRRRLDLARIGITTTSVRYHQSGLLIWCHDLTWSLSRFL